MKTEDKLKRIFTLLLEAVKRDPSLASEIDCVLGRANGSIQIPRSTRTRRKPAAFDPFVIYQQGEVVLRARLGELGLDALKDIVAEHGMDTAKLVNKWKTCDRIVDHIVSTVQARSKKGDAFRS